MRHMALTRLLRVRQPHLCQHPHRRGCATKMVLSRITDTVEMHRNIHYHVMIGKRPGREQQATHRAMQTLINVVDFSKAFDTVDPPILAKRPQSFPGTRLKHWLRNFLAHRYAQAKLGNPLGKQYALKAGVPKEPFLHHNHPPCKPPLSQSCW
ncbi:Reverse transcriptase (RNA-dependent DNA polymerase), putative [Leishmania lindenbergi]|uniref:Reverse transcriptase domain-containing protein n=1 Tax=Leishmania lindenbergi TaxID=651832 RepID=A0AAW3ANX2_9TRYP